MKRSSVVFRSLPLRLFTCFILFAMNLGFVNAQRNTTVYLDEQGQATAIFSASETLEFDCKSVGVHTVILETRDLPIHKVQITVADTTRPVVICADFIVELTANGTVGIS